MLKKTEPQKYRQFHDEYIGLGFKSASHNPPSSLYCLCIELLANSAMKTAHLQHHLRTKHPHQVGNSLKFFRKKIHGFTSCQENMKKTTSASAKALKASLLLAKAKKPFSLFEELISLRLWWIKRQQTRSKLYRCQMKCISKSTRSIVCCVFTFGES